MATAAKAGQKQKCGRCRKRATPLGFKVSLVMEAKALVEYGGRVAFALKEAPPTILCQQCIGDLVRHLGDFFEKKLRPRI